MAQAVTKRAFTIEVRPGEVIRGDVRPPSIPIESTEDGAGLISRRDPAPRPIRRTRRGDEAEPVTAVVVVHGFKGFKDWGFFPWVSDQLAQQGHHVVSFNFSRNGVGEDLESFSELERFGENTFTLELDELRRIIDLVCAGELTGSTPARIGLLGHSRGGGQAVLATAEDARVASLVTWNAVATFDRWTEQTKETWRRDGRIWISNQRTGQEMPLDVALLEDFEAHRERLDILAAAHRIRAPWLVVHGLADETVDPNDGRALLRAARGAVPFWVEGAGHTFQARHPFGGAPEPLQEAFEATARHFWKTLGG